MGKFVFLFLYVFISKYQLDFTNFILVYTNSLFFYRQYIYNFYKTLNHKTEAHKWRSYAIYELLTLP